MKRYNVKEREKKEQRKIKKNAFDSRSSSRLEIAFHHRTAAKSDKGPVFSKMISSAFVFPTIRSCIIAIEGKQSHTSKPSLPQKQKKKIGRKKKIQVSNSFEFHFSDDDMGENPLQWLPTYNLIVNLNSLRSIRRAQLDY